MKAQIVVNVFKSDFLMDDDVMINPIRPSRNIFYPVLYFSDFLGPTLGGIMMDNISFDMIMTYTAIGCCGMVCHRHHRFNLIPRLFKGLDGCFPTA